MAAQSQPLFEEEVLTENLNDLGNRLIIHNDDINTFDWVIQALIEICKHTAEQAEQCSLLIHYKGKYAVKHGPLHTLNPMRIAICERGINATIE